MRRRPPRSTRTDPLCPDTTLFRSRFVDDLQVPGVLHAAFVRSTYPHARIRGVDATAARLVPGVHAVFTGAELAAITNPITMTVPFEGAKRSEEHTSELQSLMRISYAVFCLKKKTTQV